ncbi:MAG: hypothetical protein ABI472_12300 [Ginsengibacter sp.]
MTVESIYKKIRAKLAGPKEMACENSFDYYYNSPKTNSGDYNKKILTDEQANEWLTKTILAGKPFFASRFGGFELGLVCNHLFNRVINKKLWSKYSLEMLARDAAWHGDIKKQESFYDGFLRSVHSIDGLGVWFNHGEDVMANYICPGAELFELIAYEPYFYAKPWTMALENKKVLVIHPYTSTIPLQYAKRDLLFNQLVLPFFHLQCYKPFSTYDNEWMKFENIQATLDKMINDISKLDFDIALIASGPQGLPLGAAIKKMNRQAIHVGGALQLFFGILGKRWEEPGRPQQVFFNEHWVRPHTSEIPTDARALKFSDAGCYW